MTSVAMPTWTGNLARMAVAAAATALVTVCAVPSCGGAGISSGPSGSVVAPVSAGPAGTLASGCFGWPGVDFSPTNKAGIATFLAPGQQAVEFALRDTTGALVRLSDLLRTRPVLLVHGSFT